MLPSLSSVQAGRWRFAAAGILFVTVLLLLPFIKSRSPPLIGFSSSASLGLTKNVHSIYQDVTNSTLGFERIYVLNLPERTDKRDSMILQAAVSGLELNFVDGVKVDFISEKILPIKHEADFKTTWVAAWRAHMNAISEIVHQNLTSALIMEDDIDWDISLKDILRDIAIATSAISRATTASEMDFDHLSSTEPPEISPYGDDWDVMWLGHCGTSISDKDSRVLKHNDLTVAQPQYLHSWDPAELTPLSIYPNHTRLTGHLTGGVCSLAYAVSQAGARKILYDMGIQYLDMGYDLMLRAFCNGDSGRRKHKCFGVLPPVFEHYRRAGSTAGDSDLHDVGGGTRDRGFTMNIRHSVALNLDKLLDGSTDYTDQYPDT